MARLWIVIAFLACLVSCKKEDALVGDFNLKSCLSAYLKFGDPYRAGTMNTVVIPDAAVISFEYAGGRITRVNAGYFVMVAGTNFDNLGVSSKGYDLITYKGNNVEVMSTPKTITLFKDDSTKSTVYTYDGEGRLAAIVKRNGERSNFVYAADSAVEKDVSGTTLRTFFFTNGNLTKIVELMVGYWGNIYGKKEILLEGYDNRKNPLKGKHYICGAFYRAFSVNNFTSWTENTYSYDNGCYTLNGRYNSKIEITYDSNNRPLLGEYL